MNNQEARELVIRICRLGWQKGYLAAADGNLSLRLGEQGPILITPSGRSKALIQPEDLIEVDLEGNKLSGQGKPSTEIGLHLLCYRQRPETGAVAHAHPPLVTALTASGHELDLSGLPEALLNLGRVPVAPYASPGLLGGDELARSVEPLIQDHDAVLLAHHGSLALGPSLERAWALTEKLENAAQVFLAARSLGGMNPLPQKERERLRNWSLAQKGDEPDPLPLAERAQLVSLPITEEFLTEKRMADERGEAHFILNGKNLRRATVLGLKKGSGFRGGHVHRLKREWLYLFSGSLEVQLVCTRTGEELTLVMEPGDRLLLPPDVAHRLQALADSQMVELCDQPYRREDDHPFEFAPPAG